MKLRLTRKAKTRSRIEVIEWRARNEFDVNQSRTVRRCELFIKRVGVFAGRNKEVSVKSAEVATDSFSSDDRFDLIDGCHVTFCCETRSLQSMQALELGEPVVESKR